jgi:hypothetical protein
LTIAIIESELREALSGTVTDWPIRWPNEPWPANISLSNGNLPTNSDGTPMPCVEAEVIHGTPITAIGDEGQRVARRNGLFKVYLIYPQGIGSGDLTTHADTIEIAFNQKTIQLDTSQWQRLTTYPPRTDNNAAAVESGNRYVRVVTIPYEFFYRS